MVESDYHFHKEGQRWAEETQRELEKALALMGRVKTGDLGYVTYSQGTRTPKPVAPPEIVIEGDKE